MQNEDEPQDNEYERYPELNIKTNRLMIGGILLILAGILAIFGGVFLLTLNSSDPALVTIIQMLEQTAGLTHEQALEQVQNIFLTCGIVECILSIFPILGGIAAINRKMKNIALIGGFLGVFTIGPLLFISTILSIIGLILIMTSKNEFQEPNSQEYSFEK